MNFKDFVKKSCIVSLALLSTGSSFAMNPGRMLPTNTPENVQPVEDRRITDLRNYMNGLVNKIYDPNNTNDMVRWARAHSNDPAEVNRIIYQLWANGANPSANVVANFGDSIYVLPQNLRDLIVEESKLLTNIGEQLTDATMRAACDKRLAWSKSTRPGMGHWTSDYLRLNINNYPTLLAPNGSKLIQVRDLINLCSRAANAPDFFGNCIVGACAAYTKCKDLGLECFLMVDQGGHFATLFECNGTKYIVNYPQGVLGIVDNTSAGVIESLKDFQKRYFDRHHCCKYDWISLSLDQFIKPI